MIQTREKLKPGETVLVPRSDPVLWGGAGSAGPLTRQQLESFERDGYTMLEGVLDAAKAGSLLAEARELARTCEETGAAEVYREPGSDAVKSVFQLHLISASMRAACLHTDTVRAAEQILADRVHVFQSRINYQMPFVGKGFTWHSDFETWHSEDGMPRMRAVSSSLMLQDNLAVNGALMIMPGSHKRFAGVGGATPANNWETSLRHQTVGSPSDEQLGELARDGGIVHCEGKAGSVLLFDCNTMHGSHSNQSPWGRTNCFTVFNAVSNRLAEVPNPRPCYLANRGDTDTWTSASGTDLTGATR